MKTKAVHGQPNLVRTTVRLRPVTRSMLERLRFELRRPMQAIIDDAVSQYAQRANTANIQKYLIRIKAGQAGKLKQPFWRSEFYEEVLNHRIRPH